MEDTRDIIAEIIGDISSIGYIDLRGVGAMAAEREIDGVEYLQMGTILGEYEKMTGRKAQTVSKSLGRITAIMWESGNRDVFRELYQGHLPSTCPSPKSLVIRLAYFERRRKRQMKDVPNALVLGPV